MLQAIHPLALWLTYNTSGAREIIFMYPLSRNSLATGPKIRVPRGSSELFSNHNCIVIKTDIRTIFTT